MRRRSFLGAAAAWSVASGQPPALAEEHFPSRLYQFVWRNWELANLDRMARVVGATPGELRELGSSMGLPAKRELSEDSLRRIYITVIRQNWFLLPEAQLIELLGWNEARFRFTLKEDDFLDVKLGPKPACEALRYRAPSLAEKKRASQIRALLKKTFGAAWHVPGEDRFAFVRELSTRPAGSYAKGAGREVWSPRYLYSYFALYGDPLMEGDAAGLPEAYLERAAAAGATGVWIQAVLNTLAPSKTFPEFGDGWQTRMGNLRALVERAGRAGMKIYLYLNEPRAMPGAFFGKRPEMQGSLHQGVYAMCTSAEAVRDWMRSTISHVFREAPGLGGLFSITMSENHTNCFSHGGAWGDRYPKTDCPRCSRRKPEDVLAELIACFRDGVREQSKTADVISYDWGWGTPLADTLIPKLPRDTAILSISEWSQPVERGGVKTAVGEYSMSVTGPGPRAKRNWKLAKQNGLKALAKTQFNNTWEISAVPWIPVMPLVVEHCEALAAEGIDGLMPSWTCGGYPSANLRAAAAYAVEPRPAAADVLRAEAERMYGADAAPLAVQAWQAFSDAFREFPYGVSIYIIPTQHGPANLLRLKPTHLKAGMILFPHDAYKSWCGAYPPDVVLKQFRAMAAKWGQGIAVLERAARISKKKSAERELAIARTCLHHFQSVANQVEFYMLREAGGRARMLELVKDEMDLSRRQFEVARAESLIGYEASNHYYYTPLDLGEKVINCDWIARQLRTGAAL